MAEEEFISKFDGTTENRLLEVVSKNISVFPFDTELNETSSKGLPNSVIAKEINAIKNATSNNKGYFLTEEALMKAYPSANEGCKAYVGSGYPYKIYLYTEGLWTYSGKTGGDDSFNAGEFYTRAEIDQQRQAINNEISRVGKGANYEVLEYEVNIATTRLKVPEENRKGGYMITYNPGTGWIKEQYIGTVFSNEEWVKDVNWDTDTLKDSIQEVYSNLKNSKQDKLVSGTNIKSLNDESIVGNGNIEVQNLIDKRLTDFRTYGRRKGSFVEVPTKAEFEEMRQFFLDLFIEQGLLTDATSSAITNRSIFRNGLSLTNN